MSRLCLLGADLGAAITYATLAVRSDSRHGEARAALESALARRPNPPLALERYNEALAIEPEIAAHTVCYASAPPFPRIDRARSLLEEALNSDPALAPAHAALANVFTRESNVTGAIRLYQRALDLDPNQPDAALALSELLFDVENVSASAAYRAQALEQKRFYPAGPRSANAPRSVLVLNAPAPWAQNTPLELMVDPAAAKLHRLYLTEDPPVSQLPPYDVVFNAIGEAESLHEAINCAQRFIDAQTRRVINRPRHLWKTSRSNLAGALAGVYGCEVTQTKRIPRGDLASRRDFPFLARPIDTHAGRGLERVDDAPALEAYLAAHHDERFDVAPFVEYRSADGYYRKYRVILVDGKPYPYHLAISPHWMVHYIKTPTASIEWMRAEEKRFLRSPAGTFSNWERTFAEMAQALGLEYAGVDCTLLPNGNVLVFEADTALLVHCREPAGSYKHEYVPAIFRAVEALLSKD